MKELLYDWHGANIWLFHAINDVRGEYIDRLMLFGTRLGDHGNFPIFVALAALAGLYSIACRPQSRYPDLQRQAYAWLAALTVLSAAYLADALLIGWLKPMLDFPRPPLALPLGTVHIIGPPEYHHSLPSGHSAFAMLIVASLWGVLNGWWRSLAVVFLAWVGISRVSLGAHFPADVLAGFLLSLVVVMAVAGAVRVLIRLGNPKI
jgi:membrane-associated phospholipid phosphatase